MPALITDAKYEALIRITNALHDKDQQILELMREMNHAAKHDMTTIAQQIFDSSADLNDRIDVLQQRIGTNSGFLQQRITFLEQRIRDLETRLTPTGPLDS